MADRLVSRRVLATLVFLVAAGGLMAPVSGRADGLETWVDQEVEPWLTARFTEHPRFKGEAVRVAVFQGNDEDPTPDLLSSGLADDLERVLSRHENIRLVQRPLGPDWDDQQVPTRLRCVPPAEAYIVAVEAQAMPDATASVRVRILDTDESVWVPGAVREWHGRLSGEQRRQLTRSGARNDLRGRRDLPYQPGQEDLMAGRAAHALGCALLAHPAENLTLWVGDPPADEESARVARLVPRYLERSGVVRMTTDRSEANLELAVESQPLDAVTRQVWITVSPKGDDPALPNVRTSLYAIAIPAPTTPPGVPAPGRLPDEGLSLGLVPARCADDECGADSYLEFRAPGAAGMALLAITIEGSVLRLYPTACPVDYTADGTGGVRWPMGANDRAGWLAVFAVAAATPRAAVALQRELGVLPTPCETATLRGTAARNRLVSLQRRLSPFGGDIRWRRAELPPAGDGARLATAWKN